MVKVLKKDMQPVAQLPPPASMLRIDVTQPTVLQAFALPKK